MTDYQHWSIYFLLPYCHIVTSSFVSWRKLPINHQKQKSEEKHAAELLAEAKQIKEQLEKEENRLQFTEKVGPDGRTFGSITAKKIAEGLQKQFGIKVDKRHIELEHPIRAIGLIEVPVKLHKEVSAQIKLNIKNSAE